jgi:hypothetical protein
MSNSFSSITCFIAAGVFKGFAEKFILDNVSFGTTNLIKIVFDLEDMQPKIKSFDWIEFEKEQVLPRESFYVGCGILSIDTSTKQILRQFRKDGFKVKLKNQEVYGLSVGVINDSTCAYIKTHFTLADDKNKHNYEYVFRNDELVKVDGDYGVPIYGGNIKLERVAVNTPLRAQLISLEFHLPNVRKSLEKCIRVLESCHEPEGKMPKEPDNIWE